MEDRIFHYKYYILDKKNGHADGVVDEIMGKIKYHNLCIEKMKMDFSAMEEDVIMKIADSPERETESNKLSKHFERVELTQDYWTAWEHLTGRKRKAINTNDTTAG